MNALDIKYKTDYITLRDVGSVPKGTIVRRSKWVSYWLCRLGNGCNWVYYWFMLRTDTIQITPEMLALIAKIDEFKGAWRALGFVVFAGGVGVWGVQTQTA